MIKNPPANDRRQKTCWFYLWVRKILGVGNGNPLQYSSLGNPVDRGAWWATAHGVAKSWMPLGD